MDNSLSLAEQLERDGVVIPPGYVARERLAGMQRSCVIRGSCW